MHLWHAEPTHFETVTLRGGNAGIMQTARIMRELVQEYKASPVIRQLALSLVSFLPEKDEVAEISALFHFVRDQIRYVNDIYGIETLQTPVKTLEIGQGDCDDKSTLLAALLESIGYATMFKLTGYHGKAYEHVYVLVNGQNVTCHLDATEPEDMGWEAPNATVSVYVRD